MNIITGYRGEAHITADQIRDQNQGCFGDGSYILDVGSKLEATAVSATSVQLSDGIISHQGCTASIPYGSTEAVTIGNGTQGMQRIDLIVARYTKDGGTGVEDMSLAVIQGTPAASNPSTPSYNEGSIHAGDSPVDMPLFEVALDGISIDSITQVASVVKTQAETDDELTSLSSSLDYNTRKDTGWMFACGQRDIDQMNTPEACGVWWLNISDTDVSGTKPTAAGQGILFVLRQSQNAYRQTYIGITQNQKVWNRYYNTNSASWSAWAQEWSN